jgi:hypothetical protein
MLLLVLESTIYPSQKDESPLCFPYSPHHNDPLLLPLIMPYPVSANAISFSTMFVLPTTGSWVWLANTFGRVMLWAVTGGAMAQLLLPCWRKL